MFSKPIQTLIDYFLKFPGVGPKQATRFAFHLLREGPEVAESLATAVARLHDEVKTCRLCYKTYDANHGTNPVTNSEKTGLCEFCRNDKRDPSQVLVVEKEVDLVNIERTGTYQGRYHVLGGTISPLDSSAPTKLHLKELFGRIEQLLRSGERAEVILATNPTTEGDATALYLERILTPLKNQYPVFTISRLGRGLTTGSELEYSDEATITNALENRK